jgi:hypothetical protein
MKADRMAKYLSRIDANRTVESAAYNLKNSGIDGQMADRG